MIDDEETFRRFGYKSTELSEKSTKKIVATCDICSEERTLPKQSYRPLCRSCANKRIGEKHRKRVKRTCLICGGEFFVLPNRAKNGQGKYCSRECLNKAVSYSNKRLSREKNPNWKGGKVKRVCQFCGKVFFVTPAIIKYGHGIYCSKFCATRNKTGANNNRWKGGKVERVCQFCGKVFFENLAKVKRGEGIYCSRSCAGRERIGGKNGNWKGGKVERVCRQCGKSFFVYPTVVKYNGGIFCSVSCASKWRRIRMAIPTHHTEPEMIFAKISEKNEIGAEYTGNGKLWIGKKGGHKLNPDFIIKVNGKKYAIEIFGDYWHSPLLNPYIHETARLSYRKAFFKKHKWRPIFIWERDLKRNDAEAFVLALLKKEGVIE